MAGFESAAISLAVRYSMDEIEINHTLLSRSATRRCDRSQARAIKRPRFETSAAGIRSVKPAEKKGTPARLTERRIRMKKDRRQ